MSKDRGVEVRTFVGAGKFQHKTFDIGLNTPKSREGEISNGVVEQIKSINEQIWNEMPDGSGLIITRVLYELPVEQRGKFLRGLLNRLFKPQNPKSGEGDQKPQYSEPQNF